jgi:hypothetical protein
MRSVAYFLVFLIQIGVIQAQSQTPDLDYGLAFSSHEVSKDHRTALDLNPERPYTINKDFTVSFDLALQRLTNAYGYILRVIANDSVNIDLMSTPEHEEFHDLTLVINNKPTDIQFDFTDVGLKPHQWTKLTIEFSRKRNQIILSWNGTTKSHPFSFSNLNEFRFYFGMNDFRKFNTTDVPPIIIKNLSLLEDHQLMRKWLMQKHHFNEVYDSVKNATATVKNPTWLIDRSTRWSKRKTFSTARFPSVAFNSEAALLYVTDEKNVYTYDLRLEKLETKTVKGSPVHSDANQLLYVQHQNQLLNYDLFTNKLQSFDFEKNQWPNTDTTYQEPNYWHNNKFYNAFDKTLYTFGGYGHFTYYNSFYKFDQIKKAWVKVETSGSIPPRYLSASGLRPSTDQVLIFGGYGSLSGKQELSPQSFYDLYSFDLRTHEVKKVREFAPPQQSEDIVFSNSLIVNEEDNSFYVLSFPKNKYQGLIKLRQYSLDDQNSRVLGDSIAFHFHDEDSFCDLFYSSASNELIAVTVHQEKGTYQVQVHSINYPPLQAQDVLQPGKAKDTNTVAVAGLIILLVITGLGLVLYIKRKKRVPIQPTSSASIPEAESRGQNSNVTPHYEVPKLTSSILLFGGFQVFDKSGKDISAKFTTTLKELFSLILLHSVRYEKGISTVVIQECLWPDKDEVSARNNRNVNIKKLRTLLEEIGNISIENNNAYLRLTMDENIFCDYQTVYRLLSAGKNQVMDEREKIKMIIRNVNRGNLLPNIQNTTLDNFKSDISNQIIDTLIEYSRTLDGKTGDKLLLEIADAIFMYDTINQEALVIKCSVLNKEGKYSLAKTWYDHFAKEYKNLYSEPYPRSFEEVIS